MKKYAAFILASLLICLCTSCASTSSKKAQAKEPVIENVDVNGIWVNLSSDDKEFIRAISGNKKFEDMGFWFKPKGIVQIVVKTKGTYYTIEQSESMMKYKVSGAGLSLKFPDGSIIKGIVKIDGNQMTYTVPDNPPIVLMMIKYKGEEPKILK